MYYKFLESLISLLSIYMNYFLKMSVNPSIRHLSEGMNSVDIKSTQEAWVVSSVV